MKSCGLLMIVCFLSILPCVLLAQKESDHLATSYDKFRDITLLGTKPDDVDIRVGKNQGAAGFSAVIQVEKDKKPTEVMLYFTPQTFSVGGNAKRSAFEMRGGRLLFNRQAEVIILIGEERIKPIITTKEYGLDGASRWREGFVAVVTVDVFKKMAANKWEMAIGDVEIDFAKEGKTLSNRVRPHLQALAVKLETML